MTGLQQRSAPLAHQTPHRSPSAPFRRGPGRAVVVAVVAALALGVVACGGGHHATDDAPAGRADVALQRQMVDVVAAVSPRVVQIQTARGLGSGVVFDADGHVVTNAHVVEGAHDVQITAADGRQYGGTVIGSFPEGDLAVVAAHDTNLEPATFGSSSDLKVGQVALAIGNPLGLRSSVTNGIISALDRTVPESPGRVLPHLVQTSAPINPGNSGGALVDLSGRVIGIPTLAAVDPELGGGAANGIGFAIPSDIVQDIAKQVIKHGKVVHSHRAFLGVQLAPGFATGRGAIIAAIDDGGPADHAGLRPGDVITAIDRTRTPSIAALSVALAKLQPGQTITVHFIRDGHEQTTKVTLGEYPAGSNR
jgi:S1-C subfamily serine protease